MKHKFSEEIKETYLPFWEDMKAEVKGFWYWVTDKKWANLQSILNRAYMQALEVGFKEGYMNRKEEEKSKEIKAEGFSEPKRNVAVISLSISDFNLWKSVNGLKSDGMGMPGRFMIGNTTFFNISDPCHSISLVFDAYAETEQAKKNKKYDRIKLCVRGGLK